MSWKYLLISRRYFTCERCIMHYYELRIIILAIMLFKKIFGAISCSIKNWKNLVCVGFRHPTLIFQVWFHIVSQILLWENTQFLQFRRDCWKFMSEFVWNCICRCFTYTLFSPKYASYLYCLNLKWPSKIISL